MVRERGFRGGGGWGGGLCNLLLKMELSFWQDPVPGSREHPHHSLPVRLLQLSKDFKEEFPVMPWG